MHHSLDLWPALRGGSLPAGVRPAAPAVASTRRRRPQPPLAGPDVGLLYQARSTVMTLGVLHGQYASFNGHRIMIGTCEDMYYLRADQLHLVWSPELTDLTNIRFRFPFPDEDHREPGDFDDSDRGLTVWGYEVPDGVDHQTVQFNYHFNGFRGPARIVQQRVWAGVWATVMACGLCGARYRLPDLESARPLLDAIGRQIADAERDRSKQQAAMWHTVAERIERGYHTPAPDGGTDHR